MGDRTDSPRQPPSSWVDALSRGRADVAAGRTHDLEEVLREIEAEADDKEARERQHGPASGG